MAWIIKHTHLIRRHEVKLADGIVILASVYTADGEDKIAMTASVGKHLTGKIKAGDIIKHPSENLGGKGGGKPDFAQGVQPTVANRQS